MRNLLSRFWDDDCGALISSEWVIVATILVLGMVVGLKAVELAVNDELSEYASAISAISQSYRYCGTSGACAWTHGSRFSDTAETFTVICFNSFDGTALTTFNCP
jgi:Flp pilus assembly pilin Flp